VTEVAWGMAGWGVRPGLIWCKFGAQRIKPSPIARDPIVAQKAEQGFEKLADRLRSLGVRYASVFGSVAALQAKPDSDIDVAVLNRGPLSTADRERFMTAIAESTGRSVDL